MEIVVLAEAAGTECLSANEQHVYQGLPSSQRQTAWLAGRLAAKRALAAYFQEHGQHYNLSDLEIQVAATGQPFYQNLHLSISHSDTHAVAAVSDRGPVGIDIERIRKFPTRVFEEFLTTNERQWITSRLVSEQDLYTTVFWSAKEAILKALGLGLRARPDRIGLKLSPGGQLTAHTVLFSEPIELWYDDHSITNHVIVRADLMA